MKTTANRFDDSSGEHWHDLDAVIAEACEKREGVLVATLPERLTFKIPDEGGFKGALRSLVDTYCQEHPRGEIVVVPEHSEHVGLWLRIYVTPEQILQGSGQERLADAQRAMVAVCEANGLLAKINGTRWLEIRFPESSKPAPTSRKTFPKLPRDDWEAHYRGLMELTTDEGLYRRALRFAGHATRVAEWAFAEGYRSVLCPAVGICIDPWIFAEQGFDVWAQDLSSTAIQVLSNPQDHPLVYSAAARDRLMAREACMWGGNAPPMRLPAIPDLSNPALSSALAERITFSHGEQTRLDLEDQSVDLLFACNALPRTSKEERGLILDEWYRVLYPKGFAFVAMHNAYGVVAEVAEFFKARDWDPVAVSVWRGRELELDYRPGHGRFQAYGSSG